MFLITFYFLPFTDIVMTRSRKNNEWRQKMRQRTAEGCSVSRQPTETLVSIWAAKTEKE